MMTGKETALADQALAGADALLRSFGDAAERADIEPYREWLRPLLASAWLDGRQAGGDEAKAIVRRYFNEVLGR